MATRLIIAGSRTLTAPPSFIDAILAPHHLPPPILLISGGARGIDAAGEACARSHSYPIHRHLPDWHKYGRTAGFVRNTAMARTATHLLAIWDGHSPGTAHMIRTARALNLITIVHAPSPTTTLTQETSP